MKEKQSTKFCWPTYPEEPLYNATDKTINNNISRRRQCQGFHNMNAGRVLTIAPLQRQFRAQASEAPQRVNTPDPEFKVS